MTGNMLVHEGRDGYHKPRKKGEQNRLVWTQEARDPRARGAGRQHSSLAALTLSFGLRANLRPRLIHLERQGRERREAKSGDRPTAQGRKVRWVLISRPAPRFPLAEV